MDRGLMFLGRHSRSWVTICEWYSYLYSYIRTGHARPRLNMCNYRLAVIDLN